MESVWRTHVQKTNYSGSHLCFCTSCIVLEWSTTFKMLYFTVTQNLKFFIYYSSAARAEGAMSAYLRHEERGGGRRGRRGGQQLGAGRRGAGRRTARVEHVHVRLLYVCNNDTTRSHASRASLARRPSERLLFWKLEVTRTDSKIIDLK